MQGVGCGVWGVGYGMWHVRCWVWGLESGLWGSKFGLGVWGVWCLGLRVWDFGFGIRGLEFGVWGGVGGWLLACRVDGGGGTLSRLRDMGENDPANEETRFGWWRGGGFGLEDGEGLGW